MWQKGQRKKHKSESQTEANKQKSSKIETGATDGSRKRKEVMSGRITHTYMTGHRIGAETLKGLTRKLSQWPGASIRLLLGYSSCCGTLNHILILVLYFKL